MAQKTAGLTGPQLKGGAGQSRECGTPSPAHPRSTAWPRDPAAWHAPSVPSSGPSFAAMRSRAPLPRLSLPGPSRTRHAPEEAWGAGGRPWRRGDHPLSSVEKARAGPPALSQVLDFAFGTSCVITINQGPEPGASGCPLGVLLELPVGTWVAGPQSRAGDTLRPCPNKSVSYGGGPAICASLQGGGT